MNNTINSTVLNELSECLHDGDEKMQLALYEYGQTTGRLSQKDILLIWNDFSLKRVSNEKLTALFNFLSQYHELKHLAGFFPQYNEYNPPEHTSPINSKDAFLSTPCDKSILETREATLAQLTKHIEPMFFKDLCELDKDSAIVGLNSIGFKSEEAAKAGVAILLAYCKWCYNAGYYAPYVNELSTIQVSDVTLDQA